MRKTTDTLIRALLATACASAVLHALTGCDPGGDPPAELEVACSEVALRVCRAHEDCGSNRPELFDDCVALATAVCPNLGDPREGWDECEFSCDEIAGGGWTRSACFGFAGSEP